MRDLNGHGDEDYVAGENLQDEHIFSRSKLVAEEEDCSKGHHSDCNVCILPASSENHGQEVARAMSRSCEQIGYSFPNRCLRLQPMTPGADRKLLIPQLDLTFESPSIGLIDLRSQLIGARPK